MRNILVTVILLVSSISLTWAEGRSLPDFKPVYFSHDSAEISKSARKQLDGVVRVISERPDVTLVLEGHTDDRYSEEYALALGERIAGAVRNYLVAKGVFSERITTISAGKSKPADTSRTKSARDRNRRVEIKLDKNQPH